MSSTPILDRQTPIARQPELRRWKSYLIGALIGVAIVIASFLGRTQGITLSWALAFLLWLFVGIFVHELGHLGAGLNAGFELRQFVAGPLVFRKEANGLRFRFLPKRFVAGGLTSMVPVGTENLRRRYLIFILGGPIATALLFSPLLVMPVGTLRQSLLIVNLVLAYSSWVPRNTGGYQTDAKLIQWLAQEGPPAEALAAVFYLTALDARGTDPRKWPADVIKKLSAPEGEASAVALRRVFLHLYIANFEDPEPMAEALEAVLSSAGVLRADLYRAYLAEAAWFQGRYRNNAVLARQWLDDARKVKSVISTDGWDAGAMAGIAMAEGNEAEKQAQLARAIDYMDRQPGTSGLVAATRERLKELR